MQFWTLAALLSMKCALDVQKNLTPHCDAPLASTFQCTAGHVYCSRTTNNHFMMWKLEQKMDIGQELLFLIKSLYYLYIPRDVLAFKSLILPI
jgi:hypothetical protein